MIEDIPELGSPFMSPTLSFDLSHFRLLWLIYNSPNGITGRELVEQLRQRGWCGPETTPEDLGIAPDTRLHHPKAPANEP